MAVGNTPLLLHDRLNSLHYNRDHYSSQQQLPVVGCSRTPGQYASMQVGISMEQDCIAFQIPCPQHWKTCIDKEVVFATPQTRSAQACQSIFRQTESQQQNLIRIASPCIILNQVVSTHLHFKILLLSRQRKRYHLPNDDTRMGHIPRLELMTGCCQKNAELTSVGLSIPMKSCTSVSHA